MDMHIVNIKLNLNGIKGAENKKSGEIWADFLATAVNQRAAAFETAGSQRVLSSIFYKLERNEEEIEFTEVEYWVLREAFGNFKAPIAVNNPYVQLLDRLNL